MMQTIRPKCVDYPQLLHALVHCNITEHPTTQWAAQQVVEAFPWDEAPRSLLRDRDRIDGTAFRQRVTRMGIKEGVIAPQSPWLNPYVERLIGSIRRECLDHVMVCHEQHLQRLLASYFTYDHRWRTHVSLAMDCPEPRSVLSTVRGRVIAVPEVSGLHHLMRARQHSHASSQCIDFPRLWVFGNDR